jgi:flagellar motility protein MotE (MotC chaperone)
MKKLLIVAQILILILILTKVALLIGLVKKSDIMPATSLITSQALAQQRPASTAPLMAPPQDQMANGAEDNLAKEKDLASALIARKNELDNREKNLRAEEQRLLALKKEITDKIALLKSQEEKLTSSLETSKTAETKRYKDMAKVYEAAPPAKAGKMLEQLDVKTAAGLTMNMKKDKAGAIWGYITPQKAAEITREITRNGGRPVE